MFREKYTDEKDLFFDLFKKDDDCFEYFKEQCKQKGVNIIAIVVKKGYKDFLDGMPYICVFVTSEKDRKEYKVVLELMNDCTKEKILPLWYETCKKFNLNLADYYQPNMQIALRCIHHSFYSYFTRVYKKEIADIVIKETSCQPKDIYASSFGYISLIFTKEQYAIIEKHADKIKNKILNCANTIKSKVAGDMDFPPLTINLYHSGMQNVNFYGLSRED